jgi:hypothetical protein
VNATGDLWRRLTAGGWRFEKLAGGDCRRWLQVVVVIFDFLGMSLMQQIPPLKSLKQFNTSDFFFKKYIHVFLLKSSMKVRKYLFCQVDIGFMGPHTSLCTNSSGLFAFQLTSLVKLDLWCLLRTQLSQTSSGWSIWGIPLTIFLLASIFRLVKFRCPSLRCQSHSSLLVMTLKHFAASY